MPSSPDPAKDSLAEETYVEELLQGGNTSVVVRAGDGYGTGQADRSRVLPAIQAIMQAHANDLQRLAVQGDPAFVKLFDSGVADNARRDAAWVRENEAVFSAAVRGGAGAPNG